MVGTEIVSLLIQGVGCVLNTVITVSLTKENKQSVNMRCLKNNVCKVSEYITDHETVVYFIGKLIDKILSLTGFANEQDIMYQRYRTVNENHYKDQQQCDNYAGNALIHARLL